MLKSDGKVYISDERRDIGLRAKFVVNFIGPIVAGKQLKYWKSSINASYTPEELKQFIKEVPVSNWEVKSNFLQASIESF